MSDRNLARDLIVEQRTKLRKAQIRYSEKVDLIAQDIEVLDVHIEAIDQLELPLKKPPTKKA